MKKYSWCFLILAFSVLMLSSCKSHLVKDQKVRKEIRQRLAEKMQLGQARKDALYEVLNGKISDEERESLEFLFAYMPLSDMADYDGSFYLRQVRTSLQARKELPWVKNIPENIYLPFVLPIRVNNEDLDTFRTTMYEEIRDRVQGMDMHQAALEINHWCHEKVNYKGSDGRTSSPLSTVRTAYGRCGEESVFTVAALRTAGIPARQVYTPRWAHTDDNHAWVEVWVDGKWYFMGACEPDAELNMGWFAEPSRRAMLVHSRAWGHFKDTVPALESNPDFTELNLIDHYAPASDIMVKVTDKNGNPISNARVDYGLYNYCEFYPIVSNRTDSLGISRARTGRGDLLIWASSNNLFDFRKVTVGSIDTINLKLSSAAPMENFVDLDLVPPVQPEPRPVSEAGQKANQLRLAKEDSIRNAYVSTFKDSAWAARLADQLDLNRDSVVQLILKSRGNWESIADFMENNREENRQWVNSFLFSLTEKDLRDVPAYCLEDHFTQGLATESTFKINQPDLFVNYVLSPRIGNELLRPWRKFLNEKFDAGFAENARKDISRITGWIREHIRIDDEDNVLSRAPLSPKGVYELGVADKRSRNIFFVALCRSIGIPARLNPLNGIPQYFGESSWRDVVFEKESVEIPKKGFILFENHSKDLDPRYYVQFTVAKNDGGVYRTIDLDEGKPLSAMKETIEVDNGSYMIVTGKRINGGAVMSRLQFFEVQPDKTVKVPVQVRTTEVAPQHFGKLDLSGLMKEVSGSSAVCKAPNRGSVIIWMDPGSEPAKHIMYDLAPLKSKFDNWGGSFFFLLPEQNASTPINDLYKGLPAAIVTASDKDYRLLSALEKLTDQHLKDRLPVVIVCKNDGEVLFLSNGYVIGIGEQIESALKFTL